MFTALASLAVTVNVMNPPMSPSEIVDESMFSSGVTSSSVIVAVPMLNAPIVENVGLEMTASTYLIFFDLEIGEIPQDTYDAIIDDPVLGDYRHYVEHERRLAEHRLTEPEEKILEETANTGGRAFGRLFVEVSSRRKYDYDGEELTQSVLLAKFHDTDRETRRKAAESLTAGVASDSHVLNYIYNTLLHE